MISPPAQNPAWAEQFEQVRKGARENPMRLPVPSYAKKIDAAREMGVLAADGAALLDCARAFIGRFCVFPSDEALTAVALWAAHAHMVTHFHATPRLILSSPEAGSGKTRVLEVLDLLVPNAMFSLSASPAAVFRTLAQRQITLLFDEVDAIFSRKGKDDNHEDLRALLNAGYKRGATIPRCVGPKHEVVSFPVFAAVALAGIGDMPDTIMTRGIIIRMRRRAPGENVDPFRSREHETPGHELRDMLGAWAAGVGDAVGKSWPKLPDGIVDRPAEIWEPLIAVADAAGGHWPDTARAACVALCKSALDRRVSLGVRLLSDLRIIFAEAEALHTEFISAGYTLAKPRALPPMLHGTSCMDDPWGFANWPACSSPTRWPPSSARLPGDRSRDIGVITCGMRGRDTSLRLPHCRNFRN